MDYKNFNPVCPTAAGRQLEAAVHTSLPPRVQGMLRAYVKVCVSAITWEYSIAPPASKLCVGLKWWGEDSPGTIFRLVRGAPVINTPLEWLLVTSSQGTCRSTNQHVYHIPGNFCQSRKFATSYKQCTCMLHFVISRIASIELFPEF